MKVLFLDFDGVLNDLATKHPSVDELPEVVRKDSLLFAAEQIDHDKVMRLNRIIQATGAYVVFTTSWTNARSFTFLCRVLRHRGFEGFILGAIEHIGRVERRFVERADEIEHWLKHVQGVTSYVILDDFPMYQLSDRHVRSTSMYGLQDHHVEQAIEVLNRPLGA